MVWGVFLFHTWTIYSLLPILKVRELLICAGAGVIMGLGEIYLVLLRDLIRVYRSYLGTILILLL